ncbi:histone H1.1, embryonic-like [Nymphalis io]|uniref:histone H1.1, embryonic-like n=1 Tax=Inachis io TaxID=171585 RepID=UPI00216A8A97|nr:histone H1.1, embryonic-like [Nymphalis io]
MSSDGSDIEMQSALSKKTFKKAPKSPTADLLKKQEIKKISTKEMINQALVDLKSRKGTSLYAIKKYLEEKYNFDVEKNNYLIKKYLKTSVEIGTIVQTKGVGATGSFKLAAGKDKLEKTKKKKEKKSEKKEKSKKSTPEKSKNTKKVESKDKKIAKKMPKKVEINKKNNKTDKKEKDVTKKSKIKKEKVVKLKANKMAKGMQTPAKKRAAMMKRKSIGSIIKPPKMKPKAAA